MRRFSFNFLFYSLIHCELQSYKVSMHEFQKVNIPTPSFISVDLTSSISLISFMSPQPASIENEVYNTINEAVVLEKAWFWNRYRLSEQWDRINKYRDRLQVCDQLTFKKGTNIYQLEQGKHPSCGIMCIHHAQK